MESESKPIILVGGGGHCASVIEIVEMLGLKIRGIIDTPEKVGIMVLGYPVIGTDEDIPQYVGNSRFVVTLGNIKSPNKRIAFHQLIENAGGELATLISPIAHVSKHATVGPGTVVMNFANVNANARIGKGCIINTGANVEHSAEIGDYCHISTGAIVNGDSRIGEATFVGSGTIIANGLSVAPSSVIGSGSNVVKNILTPGTYFGNPAKKH